jgi:hypothetical protein
MSNAHASVLVSHHLVSSFDAEAVGLVSGRFLPGAFNASLKYELMNCPHDVATGQYLSLSCQLGLCSRKLFEGYSFGYLLV